MVEIWFYAQSMQLVPHTCAGTSLSSTTTYYLHCDTDYRQSYIITYYLFTSLYAVVKELEALQGNLSGKS